MYINTLGKPIFSTKDLIEEIYRGNIDKIKNSNVFANDIDYIKYLEFIKDNALYDWPIPLLESIEDTDIVTFDKSNQHSWYMPEEYKEFPIATYLLSLCNLEEEASRVKLELELFEKNRMIDLLKFLKYLVDTMRKHNILWGVGRGSSVASYCLFLLGIHKIDSIKYDLDIKEFLR